jgi:hypothetical protein
MKSITKQFYLVVGLACFGISGTAMAAAMGPLNVGQCSGGGVTVTATTIVWTPPTLGGTAGCINTGIGTDVTYTGGTLLPAATGNILNLSAGGGAVDSFMTFAGSTLDFILTGLGPGVANTNCSALAVGASCSVAVGSPFILTNVGNGNTAVSLGAFGTVTNGGVVSNWGGAFTTQLNMTAAAIQTTELGGGSIASTESGQFTVTPIPEPGTISMFLLGGVALMGIGRRRFSKK